MPDGSAAAWLLDHPSEEVRRLAAPAAVASGRPDAVAAVRALADRGEAPARAALERLVAAPPARRFRVLGAFGVRIGAWEVDPSAWPRPMAARLVRFLLVHRGEAVPEDLLFAAFWPDKRPDAARRNLQVVVSYARAVLDVVPGEPTALEIAERTYRLRLRPGDEVDGEVFATAARAALAHRGPDRGALLEAADRAWAGAPLPEERYADWAAGWRQALVDLRAQTLAALADHRLAVGDAAGAVEAGTALVGLDPLDERAHRALVVALARAGRPERALRQFLECRRALVDALGAEPTAETAALQARVLAGEPV
jgi:DNA-binding SARP family transcriptional activator